MDAILDICYSENLFKMPERCTKNRRISVNIPNNNPHIYSGEIKPILESQRVKKEGMISLPCRATHRVHPRSVSVKENDALYDIFAKRVGRTTNFMREWLKLFVIMHKTALAQKAKGYFELKGLDITTWAESIVDGRKGDVAVLYTLNIMMETHCLVHLSNGNIWTTLAKSSGDHTKDIQKCSVHLVYIGRGLFVELKE